MSAATDHSDASMEMDDEDLDAIADILADEVVEDEPASAREARVDALRARLKSKRGAMSDTFSKVQKKGRSKK